MTPRIFISYRTSDGADKATALARDLNEVFGADQVFLDKEDLAAGAPWREAIGATMNGKPVLLLVVTPQLLGERLHAADDPVRREVRAALEVGAHLIPLLADGVDALPAAHEWPAEMHGLSERTWRRLRAYDWRADVERLVADL
jgi:TIR domain